MKSFSTLALGLAAALFLRAGSAPAQEISLRSAVVPAAPIARAMAVPVSPSAAPVLSPVLAAPSISLTPAAAAPLAAAAPAPVAAAPIAALAASAPSLAAAPASGSERAPSESARAGGARWWDGSAEHDDGPPDIVELGQVERLAQPYRTSRQLAKLASAPRPTGESYRFAVIGDAEPGRFWFWRALFNRDRDAFWSKLLPSADRSGSDFIMQLGDMVSRGIVRNFRDFFIRLRSFAPRTPYLTVIGNHDRHSPHGVSNSRVYRKLFGKTDYAFERGGRQFVVVDNSSGRILPSQLAWLRSILSADKRAIVFTHMPPAPLGEWTDFGTKGSGGFREGSAEFMRLMSERKVERVYMGHVHGFGVLERGGVRYVLTGGGGSPLYPGPVKSRFHHYLTVDDGPNGLVETIHRSDGTTTRLPL
ncbi:MAG TPA: metallophosphoesterase [Elusimicrobiota bacterium]|nr:metallophosphoesterase [Elusimicrobiota bacterium]